MSNNRRQTRKQRKHKFGSKLMLRVRRLKQYSKKNILTIGGIIITVCVSYYIYRLSYDLPDIRIMEFVEEEDLDTTVDAQGNAIHLTSETIVFKNFSLKSGFVDKVEGVPKTLDGLPLVEVVSVDKTLIGWRQEKEVEIRIKLISPKAAMDRLDISDPNEVKEKRIELRFYDNAGQLIATSPDGQNRGIFMGMGYSHNIKELKKRMTQ